MYEDIFTPYNVHARVGLTRRAYKSGIQPTAKPVDLFRPMIGTGASAKKAFLEHSLGLIGHGALHSAKGSRLLGAGSYTTVSGL